MKGFAERAIIIFPKPESVVNKHSSHMERLRSTIKNLTLYFTAQGIQLYHLSTDELALRMNMPGIKHMSNVTQGDNLFIKTNCPGFESLVQGEEFHAVSQREAVKRYPINKDMDLETRFNTILKREKYMAKEILSNERIIINLALNRNQTYKVPASVEGESRVIIKPNQVTNQVEIELGGIYIPPIDILNFNGATRPIHLWEESDWSV